MTSKNEVVLSVENYLRFYFQTYAFRAHGCVASDFRVGFGALLTTYLYILAKKLLEDAHQRYLIFLAENRSNIVQEILLPHEKLMKTTWKERKR